MLKLRRDRAGSKAHPLAARPLPLSAFEGRWLLRAALDPSRVAVYGAAVRDAKRRCRTDYTGPVALGMLMAARL